MFIGINAFFHDASCALVDEDGKVIAAAEEERFTRKKKESRFPVEAIKYCLNQARGAKLSGIAFGWDPTIFLTQRILLTNLIRVPAGISIIKENIHHWQEMRSVPEKIRNLLGIQGKGVPFRFFPHHLCHAASAYFASGFSDTAFLTLDGYGEIESMTWGIAQGTRLTKLGKQAFPDSVGKVYSGTCRFLGFNGAEKDGTVMALAAFGEPRFIDIFRKILTLSTDGLRVQVDRRYFDLRDTSLPKQFLSQELGVAPRLPRDAIRPVHQDIAASLQKRFEEVVIEMLNRLHHLTKKENLVLAGGVALNSVLNGKLDEVSPFKKIFIQPAANDSGLSLGAAYLMAQSFRTAKLTHAKLLDIALGPAFSDYECQVKLNEYGLHFAKPESVAHEAARMLMDGKIVAWFQGQMEFGPRALGHRSLLADARNPNAVVRLNEIKQREGFRPFAISILETEAPFVLRHVRNSPFMLLVDTLLPSWKDKVPSAQHVDGSVRVQTLNFRRDKQFFKLVEAFYRLTNVPLILNTSLNRKGEPIALSPDDAIKAFLNSSIDALVLGPFIVTGKHRRR